MLGESAGWGIVMEAPATRQPLPRRLPPEVSRTAVAAVQSLLPHHLVYPTAPKDKAQHEATFRYSAAARVNGCGVA